MRDAVGNSRVYGVFRDVSFGAKIVDTQTFIFRQQPKLRFHFMGCLPSTRDHLAHTTHGLRVGRNH